MTYQLTRNAIDSGVDDLGIDLVEGQAHIACLRYTKALSVPELGDVPNLLVENGITKVILAEFSDPNGYNLHDYAVICAAMVNMLSLIGKRPIDKNNFAVVRKSPKDRINIPIIKDYASLDEAIDSFANR